MGEIVAISDSDDHLPLVQKHLSREMTVVRPLTGSLTFERGGGRSAATVWDGRELRAVKAVWYRKPLMLLPAMVDAHVVAEHHMYSKRAIMRHAEQLQTAFGGACWVSDPFAIQRAERKAWQLELAADLGLLVPETVITSHTAAAAAFLAAHPATIIKPLCAPNFAGGPTECFYAKRVHGADGIDPSQLRWGPAIFQRAIDATADLRVTVVGRQVFTACIDADRSSQGQAGVRDWRYAAIVDERRLHAGVTLPDDVRRGCLALTEALGLKFAAIDLVVDRDGAIWFLEANPNGQWGFVEEQAGLPIGAALAELLERA